MSLIQLLVLSEGLKSTCLTASAQRSSMCKSTTQNTLSSWSDIQLSVHKPEHYVLHHTQARFRLCQQSLNWKFLTLSYRRQHSMILFQPPLTVPIQASVSKERSPSFVWYIYTYSGTHYNNSLGTNIKNFKKRLIEVQIWKSL